MSQPPNHPQESSSQKFPIHNVVDNLVDGVNMRGIVGPGGENIIDVQRQTYPGGSVLPPRMQQDTPSQTQHRPQEQTSPTGNQEEDAPAPNSDGQQETYNYVSTDVIGVNIQGIVAPGGVSRIREQRQSIGYQAFQVQQHPQPVPRLQGQYPFNRSGNVNFTSSTVAGYSVEGIVASGGRNQIGLQEQVFIPTQSPEQIVAPVQSQAQADPKMQHAIALLAANPSLVDAILKFGSGHQPNGNVNPQQTSTTLGITASSPGDYPSVNEEEEPELSTLLRAA